MKFLALNKKRRAIRQFNDQAVDRKDIRTAIEIAMLAPSAHNMQPWKFVVVREQKDQLAELGFNANGDQIRQSQAVIALFSDTDLPKRARKIARIGVNQLGDESLAKFAQTYPKQFEQYDAKTTSDYLAFNAGLVAMNLVLALTDQGIGSNMLLGFDKTKINDVLNIDSRFRPEVLITVGYTDSKPEPSYRLPVDEVIEER
jgi:nitroreductase